MISQSITKTGTDAPQSPLTLLTRESKAFKLNTQLILNLWKDPARSLSCRHKGLETLKQNALQPKCSYTFTSILILFFVCCCRFFFIWCHYATSVLVRDALSHLGTRLAEVFFLANVSLWDARRFASVFHDDEWLMSLRGHERRRSARKSFFFFLAKPD